MAFDFSSFDKAVGKTKNFDFSSFDKAFSGKKDFDFSSFDSIYSADEPTTGKIVKGVGAEMGASVAGSVAGGIIGGTLGSVVPFFGTAVGATVGTAIGGFAGGFLGSLWAQDIEGQEDVSVGRALGAGVVSAIPLGGAAVKGAAGATKIGLSTVGRAAGREAVKGAALGTTEATIRTVVDEGRMPTKEELATYVGAGALFGGGIGAVTPKVSKELDNLFGKVGGKTFDEIDEMVATGDLTFKDFKFAGKGEAISSKAKLSDTIAANSPTEIDKLGVRVSKTGNEFDGVDAGIADVLESTNKMGYKSAQSMSGMNADYANSGRGGDGYIAYFKKDLSDQQISDIEKAAKKAGLSFKIQDTKKGDLGLFLQDSVSVRTSVTRSGKSKDELLKEASKLAGVEIGKYNAKEFLQRIDKRDIILEDLIKKNGGIDESDKHIREMWEKFHDTLAEINYNRNKTARPQMEGILRQRLEETKGRVKSQVAVESVDASTENPSNLVRMKDRFLSVFAPSKVVGKEARNEALSFRKRIAAAEELGGRVERRVSAAI